MPTAVTDSPTSALKTLRWIGGVDGVLSLIDQTLLPVELRERKCHSADDVWEAIRALRVRGAPAIGIAAAYGVVLGIRPALGGPGAALLAKCAEIADYLATSRPTAVNLFWALDRMRRKAQSVASGSANEIAQALLAEAMAIETEDRAMCRAIGQAGQALLADDTGVLTHCNAGGLATADYGTALAVFFAAHDQGKRLRVFADETRPLFQGARLTTWELLSRGLDVTLICDSMAAQVMREGRIQAVVVGADRIAANGDTANKIGTYSVAVLARHHAVPFYVAAPSSTFDFSISSGSEIPIEHRAAEEITRGFGRQTAPEGVKVYNPAFDVTPGDLVTAFITEKGVIRPPYVEMLRKSLTAG
ncbi:MAG: S-methyl-5-thioribose-1-phosphate isomerase [Planctomycetaceae bacterium]|nr:MAG: S-methyl-5-thioribose-1-phosphate isomerase [Planctomycetaceae bacterium]